MPIINHRIGRPPKSEEEKRSKNIQIRVTEEVYDALLKLAKKNDIPISTYGRVVLEEALERDLDLERYGYDD